MRGIFVGAIHTSRHLAEGTADELLVIVRSGEHGLVTRQHVIRSRLTEALGNVHIVPVGQGGFLVPVGRVVMNLPGQIKQETVAGTVVEPQHGVEVVAPRLFSQ